MAIVKIPVAVVNKIAMVDCGTVAVADNNNYVLDVTFDAEWADYTTKTARFVCGSWVSEKIFTGNTVEMPMLPPDYSYVRVGFYAGDISTTSPAKIAIIGSIMSNAPSAIEAAEIERVHAEQERVEAEAERVANETDRITAEQDRVTAEQARVDAELARQSAEDERIANELERQAAEDERIAHGTVYIAEYGVTTFAEITAALAAQKFVVCRSEEYGDALLDVENPNDYIFEGAHARLYCYNSPEANWIYEPTQIGLDRDPTEGHYLVPVSSGGVYDAIQNSKACIADVGTTTYADVEAAIALGKVVIAKRVRTMPPGIPVADYGVLTGKTVDGAYVFDAYPRSFVLAADGTWSINDVISSVVTQDDANAVSGGAVYTALLDKQDELTFDSTPTEGSMNPVTSGGVYDALSSATVDFVTPAPFTNVYNPDDPDILVGQQIKRDGTISSWSNGQVSGFIPCKSGDTFIVPFYTSHFGTGSSARGVPLFDADKQYVSYVTGTLISVESAPASGQRFLRFTVTGATSAYFRVTACNKDANNDDIQTPFHAKSMFMVIKGNAFPNRYYPYTGQRVIAGDIYSAHENLDNPLFGKKVVFLGDSICEGDDLSGWAGRIGRANSMCWENAGVGGSCMSTVYSTGKTICTRGIKTDTPDYVIFEGGTNDADRIGDITSGSIPAAFGSFTPDYWGTDDYGTRYGFDISTFCGAFEYMCKRLTTGYAGAKIGYIVAQKMGSGANYRNRRAYFEVAMQICRKWGVAYLNLWDGCYLNPALPAHYTSGSADSFYRDGQHLTARGYDYITPIIAEWMETLYTNSSTAATDLSDYYTKSEVDTRLADKQNTLTFDNTPTAGSNNPVTSAGIYTALADKQATLTFDNAPTAGSNNPVKSSGIYADLGTKVDKVVGKGLSTNDYTNTDKAKVDNIPTATSDLTNDSDFQNSTEVNDAIAAALGTMTSLQYEIVTTLPATGAAGTVYLIANSFGSYDEYMWIGGQYYNIGSTDVDLSNYYTRAEVDTRLDGKQDALIFDATPTVLSTNPVTSGGVFEALQDKQDVLTFDNAPALNSGNPVTSEGLYLALQGKQNTLTFDGVPTALSPNPVTSAGLYTALEGKQAALTFDEQPIVNSRNPVTSSGIYAALLEKENRLTWDLTPTRNSGNPVTSGGVYAALQGTSPADIQQMINDAIAGVTGFEYQVVAELPAAGEKGVIYLVPSPLHPDQTNEYVWIEGSPSGHFEAIGTTDIDLSDYYTKTETDALINEVRVFQAQLNVTSAADIIQAVNDRKSIVVHMGAGSPSEFAVKAAISGADKVYLYTMTLNVGSPRSYPMFTRHVIEGTTWAVTNVAGAVTDDVPFIAEQGRTTPPQIEMATAKNRIIVVKTTGGEYYPCTNVSTTDDYHTRLHCLVGSYDATATTFGLALKVYDIYGATWTEYSTSIVTAADLQDAVDELNDRIDEVEATIGRFRGNYGSYALLAADSRSHRENDYAIVTVDETHANQCWYYTFSSDSVWVGRFKIRDAAFTTAQLDAINSGATTAKIDSIANKVDKVTTSGKTEVYIHSGTTQTVREIATSITGASADTSKLPTVAAVYNNKRLNGTSGDAGSTALDFDALLAKCNLNNLGNGHSWAYCRQFNSCTDRPFNSDAVYIELWGRDSSTFLVHVVDWQAQKDAWRTKNNGTWGSWNLINNRASGNSAVTYTNYSSNFTSMADYTGMTRQAWRNGSGAGVAFHLKCKCTTACNNDWYYIGTLAEGFRPQTRTPFNCTVWSQGVGGQAIGGDINTDGRIRVWINTLATNDNVQFRINASWMIN